MEKKTNKQTNKQNQVPFWFINYKQQQPDKEKQYENMDFFLLAISKWQ